MDKFNSIFKNIINYKNININNPVKMRNIKNGISLVDAIFYRLKYSQLGITKDVIVNNFNSKNKTVFSRQAFESKENNISPDVYENLLQQLISYYNDLIVPSVEPKIVAIDGTYSNDINHNELMSIGFFDIGNQIPVDLKCYGIEGKNKEIKYSIEYITNNLDKFRNTIIICDRLYFCYKFIDLLIENNIKFIIRTKGEGKNLDKDIIPNKYLKDYNLIMKIRPFIRIIKYTDTIEKLVYMNNKKGKNKKGKNKPVKIKIKNDCNLIVNLLDDKKYTKDVLLEMYRSRWDIEVYFKFIKNNFKFQHNKEKGITKQIKMYCCDLIMTYMEKIIEKYYYDQNKTLLKDHIKVNKTGIINGIYNDLLYDMINGTVSENHLNCFIKIHVKKTYNKENRSNPRISKTPFTKWYVKGYSDKASLVKIINAIRNGTIDELNNNLKSISKKIISINGKKIST